MDLTKFPKLSLGHFPTAIEPLRRLTEYLGGPEIWIKRDDCTGLATGGNKTRKLEYLMADAKAKGADMVVTQGATQSNHARQTSAAAARLGMKCHLLLEDRTGYTEHEYQFNGNVLLDELHDATIERRPGGVDMNAELLAATERKKDEGFNAYAIPGGGSNPIGALGYVSCMAEIIAQTNNLGLTFDCLVHATGSAGTQAGLVAGAAVMRPDIEILGIGVRAPQDKQENNVYALAQTTADLLGHPGVVERHAVKANCDYIGEGYGIAHQTTIEAIRLLAKLDGILLDPVYSAKGMAGLIGLVKAGHFKKGQRILFLHTGGQSALFGYFKQLQP